MLRRLSALAGAAAFAGAALVALSTGVAQAQPTCPDVHWIGASGSGERVDPTADGGMGRVIYQSLGELSQELQRDGRTITAEAVEYPAVTLDDRSEVLHVEVALEHALGEVTDRGHHRHDRTEQ